MLQTLLESKWGLAPHVKPACPLSLEEQKASKSRYYKVKGVKDATLKEAAAAAAAENSE